jgi:hypothetical protein
MAKKKKKVDLIDGESWWRQIKIVADKIKKASKTSSKDKGR